ncbi:amidohydrolase [Streptomyces sp. NPDC003077]|uniref:amidohydrolase n=1 Tax=Streptomyces sp. NPDC003077 TaxID=3154443 RepID=UPI0033AF3F52
MDGLTPLIDQHSRGALHGELGLGSFEAHLAASAGALGPASADATFFDSWTGLAVRRWCPPLLGLEPHCAPARYLARRRDLGAYHAGRVLLRGAGIGAYLVETGAPGPAADPYDPTGSLTTAAELSAAADAPVHEIVGLERLAEDTADTAGSVDGFLSATAEAVHAAAGHAVAFASRAPHCAGRAPTSAEVRRAADRWLRAREDAYGTSYGKADTYRHEEIYRYEEAYRHEETHRHEDTYRHEDTRPHPPRRPPRDPVLARYLLWHAVATGIPVQLHCPDPHPLTGFLHATTGLGTDVVLLVRAPYHQRAARLAAAYPHVYADAGPHPEETLRLAPFGKLLFSTGARGLPELYVTAARLFVRAVERTLGEWLREGVCGWADARRIAALLASGTARRIYRRDAAGAD